MDGAVGCLVILDCFVSIYRAAASFILLLILLSCGSFRAKRGGKLKKQKKNKNTLLLNPHIQPMVAVIHELGRERSKRDTMCNEAVANNRQQEDRRNS